MRKPTPAELQYQDNHRDESLAPRVLKACITCFALAAIAVSFRVLSRRLARARLGKDDYMIFAALLFAFGYVLSNFLSIHFGGMKHAITIEHPVEVAKLILIIEVLYCPAICCVKLSCLLLYHRLFPSRKFHILLWCLGIFTVLYTTAQTFLPFYWCRPVRAIWDPTVTKATCFDYNKAAMGYAILNVFTDVATVIIPVPLLWQLNLPRSRKLQVIGIFMTGGFVCIVSVYRATQMNLAREDASYADVNADIWSIVEICVGIVSACLPTMRPIVVHLSQAVNRHRNRAEKLEDAQSEWAPPAHKQPAPSFYWDSSTTETSKQVTVNAEPLLSPPAAARLAVAPFEEF